MQRDKAATTTRTAAALATPLTAMADLEARVSVLLHRAAQAAERRDRVLSDVVAVVDAAAAAPLPLRTRAATLTRVRDDVLPGYATRTAALAQVLQSTAAVAARASRGVKWRSALLQRAEATQQRVTAMRALRQHRHALPRALAAGDVERSVELLRAYAEARDALGGHDNDNDNDSDDDEEEKDEAEGGVATEEGVDDKNEEGSHSNNNSSSKRKDDVADAQHDDKAEATTPAATPRVRVSQMRATVQHQLEQLAHEAQQRDDKPAMQRATSLLARLGCVERGRALYVSWLCERTAAQLQQTVTSELHKMAEPAAATAVMTHLALVSQTLDAVVATYEAEAAYMHTHYGRSAAVTLLRELHSRATAQCVPVLSDFVAKRQDILGSVQHLQQQQQQRHRRRRASSDKQPAAAAPAAPAVRTLAVEARRVDRMLEEMTHLVSCCHVYLRFLEQQEQAAATQSTHEQHEQEQQQQQQQQQQQHDTRAGDASDTARTTTTATDAAVTRASHDNNNKSNNKEEEGSAAADGAVGSSLDHLWRRHDSPLLTAVQELLSLYVPLQRSYFALAFAQAVQLQNAAEGIADDEDEEDEDDEDDARRHPRRDSSRSSSRSRRSSSNDDAASSSSSSATCSRGSSVGSDTGDTQRARRLLASPALSPRHGGGAATAAATRAAAAAAHAAGGAHATVASPSSLMSGLTSLYAAAAQRVAGLSASSPLDGGFVTAAAQQLLYGDDGEGKAAGRLAGQQDGSGNTRHAAAARDVLLLPPTAASADTTAATPSTDASSLLTLPDDVFFVLRIALHRAVNMQSTQIASAVVMAVIDVLQEKLLPHIRRRAAPSTATTHAMHTTAAATAMMHSSGSATALAEAQYAATTAAVATTAAHGNAHHGGGRGRHHRHHRGDGSVRLPRPSALRWVTAARQVVEYVDKLSGELTRLATAAHYSARDVLRFRELATDMHGVAVALDTQLQSWLTQYAHAACALTMPAHLARLAQVTYTLSEEALYLCELHDPWVQACVTDWQVLLTCLDAHLDATSFDVLLRAAAAQTAQLVCAVLLRGQYNAYGALQVDKEVRALRTCFVARAHERSPRDVFAALSLLSTLLLCDRPRDAQEERHNNALTADEKRAVLRSRIDFAAEDVAAVQLS